VGDAHRGDETRAFAVGDETVRWTVSSHERRALGERLSAKKPCIAFPRAATPRPAGKDYFFGS